ncbi:MAG: bifunctional enoyl-CoA hydratase/phosphate acetyltransferase [Candidatus Zixiibacteriota bacterium]|nr:MAG: bifunctional enoyl-CoA hydratase/phosphate acetyltransferase [candidate division Zixibacteria bacterium]
MTPTSNQPLRTWQDVVAQAREISRERMRRVAVAAADDAAVLQAVTDARAQGICDAVLIGDREKMQKLADSLELDLAGFAVEAVSNPHAAAARAADLAAAREADVIMKGFLPTSALLKAVLAKDKGLRRSDVISHCAVMSVPGYPRLLNVTDGGMVVQPDLRQKIRIVENAVTVSRALGIEASRIALIAASDEPNLDMPRTLDNAIIAKMGDRGCFGSAVVDGPLTFDAAVSPEIAQRWGVRSPVAGQADVLVVSAFEEGNLVGKSLILFGGAVFCGVIVGAAVPVSLVSRTDPPRNKLASVAIAVVLSRHLAGEGN